MKRTAPITAIVAAGTALLILGFGAWAAIVCLAAFLAIAVVAFVKNKAKIFVLSLICLLITVNSSVVLFTTVSDVNEFDGKKCTVSGVVCRSASVGDNYISQTLAVNKINGKSFTTPIKIRITAFKGFPAKQGDAVKLTATLVCSQNTPYHISNFSQGIYITGTDVIVEAISQNNNIYSIANKIKSYVKGTLCKYLPFKQASVISALVVGEDEQIDDALRQSIINSGVLHMLVVSGMHLAIICSSLLKGLQIFFSARAAAVVTLPIIVVLAVICDFGYSIMRASLAYIILLLGVIFFKHSDSLSSLCMAVIIILIINPFAVGSVSLLLSVTATLGILVISPAVLCRIKNKTAGIKGGRIIYSISVVLVQTLSATIVSLPVSMLFFSKVSIISPLTNILTSYSMTMALCFSVISIILSCFSFLTPITTLGFALASICIKYFCFVVEWAGSIPFATITVTRLYAVLFVLLWVVGAVVGYICWRKSVFKIFLRVLAVFMVPFIMFSVYINSARVTLTVIKADQGQSVVLCYENKAVIVGVGDDYSDGNKICDVLKSANITQIEAVYLNDAKAGTAGLECVLQSYSVDNIYSVGGINKGFYALPKTQKIGKYISLKTLNSNSVYLECDGYSVLICPNLEPNKFDKEYAKNCDAVICKGEAKAELNGAKSYVVNPQTNLMYKIKSGYALGV